MTTLGTFNTDFGAPPPVGSSGSAMTPGYGGAPVEMRRRNVVLVWLVWPVLTLGIYHFVWYYKIHQEMREFDRRQVINPVGSMLTILFGAIIVVPVFVSYFNTGKRIAQAQRSAGMAATCNPWIGFLLLFVFGLTPLYYQSELNKIVERNAVR